MSSLELVPESVAPTLPLWVAVTISVLGILLSGGGLGALIKAWSDRRIGVEAHEVVEDDAIASRWEALSRSQVELLLEPLQRSLAAQEVKVTALEQKVELLDAALNASRRKYWSAIPYIRTLLLWIGRHLPEGAPTLPPVPEDIAEDLNV